jgi:hypothetical protein
MINSFHLTTTTKLRLALSNVRELKLVIERAVFTANSGVIQINDVLVS